MSTRRALTVTLAALAVTLDEQSHALDTDLLGRQDGLRDGVYTVRAGEDRPILAV